ncbi:MAG TPA: bis(5'-nucleosyl)-tetraphosphatase (symmetrical) YqeK [Candidatus Eremiobacteraceae bacterium]|nr:bis(5'-nucleosyl)-tetraphosphatase (symmetrical) YqeK [Candidatus Eremiobacteraceae bacterium]
MATDAPLSLSGSEFITLCADVRARTDEHRFKHALSVARMAERLAFRYGVSRLKARVAGMLHDIARLWKADALFAYATSHGLPVSESACKAPVLMHAPVGAEVARSEFGIEDRDVLGAIVHHTVAVPGMSDLEKIVYVADSIEPGRTFPQRAELEAAAFRSLDEGLLACVRASMDHLAARRIAVAQETMDLYDEMMRRHGGAS